MTGYEQWSKQELITSLNALAESLNNQYQKYQLFPTFDDTGMAVYSSIDELRTRRYLYEQELKYNLLFEELSLRLKMEKMN